MLPRYRRRVEHAGSEGVGGVSVSEDRLEGSDGVGVRTVRRDEVRGLRLGTASMSELPMLEGALGLASALVTLLAIFAVFSSRYAMRGAHVTEGVAAFGTFACVFLYRTFARRSVLFVEMKSGDTRRMVLTPADELTRLRLAKALKQKHWPIAI